MQKFNFKNQHSIKTVNAELIKCHMWLVARASGTYVLYERERGKPLGETLDCYGSKTMAFNCASVIVNKFLCEPQTME